MDDERDINYLLWRGLSSAGFEVDSYLDPTGALENFRPNRYSGIVLDVRMPKMSGFELARKLWDKEPNARICFLTSYEIYRQELDWVSPNKASSCFLVKPLSIAEVIAHLNQHGISPLIQNPPDGTPRD